MAQGKPNLYNFLQGTRRDSGISDTAQIPAGGGSITLNFPRNGLTTRAWIKVVLQANTNATAPAWGNSLEQALSWLRNVQIKNNQNLSIINASLYGLREAYALTKRGYDIVSSPAWSSALPALSSTFVWTFVIPLDISFNESLQYSKGLIYTQSNVAQWQVNLTFDALSNVLTNTTLSSITAQASLYSEWFEIPSDTAQMIFSAPPMNYAWITDEIFVQGANLASSGVYEYEVSPLQGEMIRLIAQYVYGAGPSTYAGAAFPNGVTTPSAGTAFVSNYILKINNNNLPETFDPFTQQARHFRTYGSNPLPGTIVFLDGATQMGYPNEFQEPYYTYQQINPSGVASLKLNASLNLNSAPAWAYFRLVRQYAQQVQYSSYK